MFGEMAAAADSPFHHHHHHHHMLYFRSHPDSTPTAAAAISPTTIPAAHAVGPNTAALFLRPPNTPMLSNAASSSLQGAPKYRFVTGSPADWTAHELQLLKEGLIRYAHEPNIIKYIKIAAMLPARTIRDVALRCCWTTGQESRRKPDELYAGKKLGDFKIPLEEVVSSTSVANIQMPPLNNMIPFSISMHHIGQNIMVPIEDHETQHLLEENNQLLRQIAANIENFKTKENTDLFLHMNNNIRTISKRMSEMPGIMGQMPCLPFPLNEGQLSLLLHLDRMEGRSNKLM